MLGSHLLSNGKLICTLHHAGKGYLGQSPKGYLNYLKIHCLFCPSNTKPQKMTFLTTWGEGWGRARRSSMRRKMLQRTAREGTFFFPDMQADQALDCVLTIPTIFLAGVCRKTTEQTECLERRSPVGLCTTVEKVSSMGITRITLCLSFIAFSRGLKDGWLWKFSAGQVFPCSHSSV